MATLRGKGMLNFILEYNSVLYPSLKSFEQFSNILALNLYSIFSKCLQKMKGFEIYFERDDDVSSINLVNSINCKIKQKTLIYTKGLIIFFYG